MTFFLGRDVRGKRGAGGESPLDLVSLVRRKRKEGKEGRESEERAMVGGRGWFSEGWRKDIGSRNGLTVMMTTTSCCELCA